MHSRRTKYLNYSLAYFNGRIASRILPTRNWINDKDCSKRAPALQVVIFNWMGLPNKHTILQRLVVMIKAGEKVMARERGESAFGHLILLVRDVKGKAAEIEELGMDDEDTCDLKEDEENDANERNRIRQGLKTAFQSITIKTLHGPHADMSGTFSPHIPNLARYSRFVWCARFPSLQPRWIPALAHDHLP